jgi:hypothetical protein
VILAGLVTPVAIANPGGTAAARGQAERLSVDVDGYALRVRNGSSAGMAARMLCGNDSSACTYARNLGRGPAAKFVASNGTPPIDVGGNATKVPGLNADLLDGLSAGQIVDNAVQRGAGSRTPGGPAGGDLRGEYPDPVLAPGVVTDATVAAVNKDGAAGTPSLRTLGAGGGQAAAGDDGRFPTGAQKAALSGTSGAPGSANAYVTDADPRNTNARTPTGTATGDLTGSYPGPVLADNSIDALSLFVAGLRDGAAGTPTLRSLGTGAAQAAAGDDGRFPTAGQKAALSGTSGTPGVGNAYVTDADPRNTNARTPTDNSVGAPKFATLPHGKMRNTGSQTFPSGPLFTQVAFNNLQFGSDVTFNDAGDSLTVQTSGTYLVTAELYWPQNPSGSRGISLLSSGSGEIAFDGREAASTMGSVQSVTAITKLNAGDSLTLFAGQSSGSSLSTLAIAGRSASLAAQWMGP